jgi:hypothetical protein
MAESARWVLRRGLGSAPSSKQYSGWLVVTHPFHPLAGQHVEVLYSMKRAGRRMFVVDAGYGARMTLPLEWTDRGPAAEGARVSQEALIELRALVNALVSRCPSPRGGRSS